MREIRDSLVVGGRYSSIEHEDSIAFIPCTTGSGLRVHIGGFSRRAWDRMYH
jgi:hypothetical protein